MDKKLINIIIPTCQSIEQIQDQINEIKKFTQDCKIIATCQKTSAAINRNIGLEIADSEIVVMMDDDISGFYQGWLDDLINPIYENEKIIVLSALLENLDSESTMGQKQNMKDICIAVNGKVASPCVAIRRNEVKFDENFIKSGYEDTQYSNQITNIFGIERIWINPKCKLIHKNEMKGQDDFAAWKHNHDYYMKLNPGDDSVRDQKPWHPDLRK